jgi:hypothetical protein
MIIIVIIILMAAAISSCSNKNGAANSNNNVAAQPTQEQRRIQKEKMAELENSFPIADYNEPEPSAPELLKSRREKSAKYDKTEITVDLTSEMVVGSSHWANNVPAFPIELSTAVVTGTVTAARGRLSNNKRGVYSEFTFQLDDVLKNDADKFLASKSTVMLDRVGGRVRLPSGKVGIYFISGQRMPIVGRRYVFFLSGKESTGFTIVTGYELGEDKIVPLDNPGSGHPFTRYDGADKKSFLEDLRVAIAKPPHR